MAAVKAVVSEVPTHDWRHAVLPGVRVYHTSVLVDRTEYHFNNMGINTPPNVGGRSVSHRDKVNTEIIDFGLTKRKEWEMMELLAPLFTPYTYDTVRKNCNTFTNCALAFLCSRCLPKRYMLLEALAEAEPGWFKLLSRGRYYPSPGADGFSLKTAIMRIDRNAWMRSEDSFPEALDGCGQPCKVIYKGYSCHC